ncbi:hypothetical protein [Curtobacterium sp. MCSS17_016]|uniref:hypothetical protein n=1 Tax=Curtobacterium sp. MCSS17_016 TaxID=2175644 RepID=UPI0011B65743|nr:hypothetical protein [Curtobacterium sp. MCSS17_016]WIE81403.1 hypothetical protein DEJ19_019400 [Curtobacterium sp. MCSS17_016]
MKPVPDTLRALARRGMLSYLVTADRSWWEWLRHVRLALHGAAGELERLNRALDEQTLRRTFRTAGLSDTDSEVAAAAVRAEVATVPA